MNRVFLLLGSNLGNPSENLSKSISLLNQKIGSVISCSSIYKTAPWGFEHEKFFLNQVLEIDTTHNPIKLLEKILSIEIEMGRKRSGKGYEGRIIDIDILFFNDDYYDLKDLIIPHPLLHKRRFTLCPLFELAPLKIHPIFKKNISELLADCEDNCNVEKLNIK